MMFDGQKELDLGQRRARRQRLFYQLPPHDCDLWQAFAGCCSSTCFPPKQPEVQPRRKSDASFAVHQSTIIGRSGLVVGVSAEERWHELVS